MNRPRIRKRRVSLRFVQRDNADSSRFLKTVENVICLVDRELTPEELAVEIDLSGASNDEQQEQIVDEVLETKCSSELANALKSVDEAEQFKQAAVSPQNRTPLTTAATNALVDSLVVARNESIKVVAKKAAETALENLDQIGEMFS